MGDKDDVREEGCPVADIRFCEGGNNNDHQETRVEDLEDCEEWKAHRHRRYSLEVLGITWERSFVAVVVRRLLGVFRVFGTFTVIRI